jgi:uncharacterized protein involved in type VI secretion and phage assembly
VRPIYDLQSAFAAQIQGAELEATRVYEPVVAVVTDNKDPSKLGRVKVKIPILSEADTSFWAPIVMMGAGKNRGWFFIPEVEDEVLVIFEHGDMDRPLVVGALWGGKDKPPDNNQDGKNQRRMIKSREGSKITLDDTDGEEKIVIEDGKGKAKITFDSKENKIIIEAVEGDVCFQAPTGDMQILAKEAELTAGKNLEIHAGSNMQWGCDTTLTIKSQNVTMSGSKANWNCGVAKMPDAPTAEPKDVTDPYKDDGGQS